MKRQHTFINEIGNRISIQIAKQKDVGINSQTKRKRKFNGIKITMNGPTSQMTNEITIYEAIVLHKLIGDLLENF